MALGDLYAGRGALSCHTDAPHRASPDQVTVHLQLSSDLIVIVIVLDPGDGSRGPKAEQSTVLSSDDSGDE